MKANQLISGVRGRGLMNLCYRLENLSIGRDIYKGLDVMQRYGVMWVYVELVGLGSSSSMEPFSS